MSILLFLFLFLHNAACIANEELLGNPDKLPDIFPLKDMKWIELEIYETFIPGKYQHGIRTYFLQQVDENKTELYVSEKMLKGTVYYNHEIGKSEIIEDTTWIEPTFLRGLISIEGKKVYIQPTDLKDGGFHPKELMYDFGLELNDTFRAPGFGGVLDAIDSVLIGNEHKKRYNFDFMVSVNDSNFYRLSLIQGVGNTEHFFRSIYGEFLNIDPMPSVELLEIYYKGKRIWKNEFIMYLYSNYINEE